MHVPSFINKDVHTEFLNNVYRMTYDCNLKNTVKPYKHLSFEILLFGKRQFHLFCFLPNRLRK